MTTDSPRHISVAGDALAAATERAFARLPRETGGILIGWRDGRNIVVDQLVEVPDDTSTGHRYHRRHAPAQHHLDQHISGDNLLGYVGEWHSHPAPHPPSPTDRRAIRGAARHAHGPIALIVLQIWPTTGQVTPTGLVAEPTALLRALVTGATIHTHNREDRP